MKQLIIFIVFVTILSTISLTCHADEALKKQFLDTHNEARAKVGVAPLIWNHTLATFAETFAKKVRKESLCVSSAKSGGPYGENTCDGYLGVTPYSAVSAWTKEADYYDHNTNTCTKGSDCSHYTQVVWKNTKSIGCAIAICGLGWPLAICEYYPPGNVPGQSPY